MWKKVVKGCAVIAILTTVLTALGIAAVNHDLKKSFQHPFDDDDVM